MPQVQGLGAILSHQQEMLVAIAYASRILPKHEQNYGVTELEALGVVWCIRHFRPYLYGHACKVYTDHEGLKSLLNTLHPSGKLARWGLAIQELDLEIHSDQDNQIRLLMLCLAKQYLKLCQGPQFRQRTNGDENSVILEW